MLNLYYFYKLITTSKSVLVLPSFVGKKAGDSWLRKKRIFLFTSFLIFSNHHKGLAEIILSFVIWESHLLISFLPFPFGKFTEVF